MLLQIPNRFLLLSLGFVLAAFAQTALAQNAASNWEALQKLKPGTKLTIKTKTGQKLNGKFRAVTDEALTFTDKKAPGKEAEIKRAEIAEIRQKSGKLVATYAAVFGTFFNMKASNRIIITRLGGLPPLAEIRANARSWAPALTRRGVDMGWLTGLMTTKSDWRANARILTDQYSPSNLLNAKQRY